MCLSIMEDIKMIEKLNLTMLTDYYEITMANGYFNSGIKDQICYFDVFYIIC